MAVAAGAVSSAALTNSSNTSTFSFNSTTDPLYICISGWFGGTQSVSTVTYNGVSATKVAGSTLSSGGDEATIWRVAAPNNGGIAKNIVVTISGGGLNQAGSLVCFNVTGQGTPSEGTGVGAKSAANGTAATVSLTASGANDLVICVIANGNGAAITPTKTGAGTQTETFDAASNGDETETSKVSGVCSAIGGTWTGATSWAEAAIALLAAAAASPAVPHRVFTPLTQHPTRRHREV